MCNFIEYKGMLYGLTAESKIVYRRYASLFFVMGISPEDNELITLEIIHRFVEVLDRYFGNVCELDLFVYQTHTAFSTFRKHTRCLMNYWWAANCKSRAKNPCSASSYKEIALRRPSRAKRCVIELTSGPCTPR